MPAFKSAFFVLSSAFALSAPLRADSKPAPRYTVVDFFAVGGGATGADAVSQTGIVSVHTITGVWTVDVATGESRQVSNCSLCVGEGINSAGDVVGFDTVGFRTRIAFLVKDGVRTNIPPFPGGGSSFAQGVNDQDEVAGHAEVADHNLHAFHFLNGTMTDLGTLGGSFSFAFAINNRSQIAGSSAVDATTEHAFLFDPDKGMRDLGQGTDWSSRASALNDRGETAGSIFTTTDAGFVDHAAWFDVDGEAVRDLGTLPGLISSEALGINHHRQIVGHSFAADGSVQHAFLYQHGQMFDLNDLAVPSNLLMIRATGINDDGVISAVAAEPGGPAHAVALVPVKN